MIARIWHGYTKPEHANAYESMLKPELLPGISKVKGYRGSYLLRREAGAEVEFITIMLWDSIDAIRAVAGEDYETAVIPEEQRKYSTTMLNRCITKSRQSTSPPRCHRFHSEDGHWRSHKPPRHSFPLISGVTPDFVNYSLLSDSYSVHRGDNFRVACQPGCSPPRRVLGHSFLATLPARLIGDKAYDSDRLDRELAERYGIEMIAPHRGERRRPTQDGRPLRRYRRRWRVERLFAWLHHFRRLVIRWEYHVENFFGMVRLGCMQILFRYL